MLPMLQRILLLMKSFLPAISINDDYSVAYVLTILNSKLLSKAFVARSEIANRNDFPQLDIATVREFPIRKINFITETNMRNTLQIEMENLYLIYLKTTNNNSILDFIQSYMMQQQEHSDIVHDMLGLPGQAND